jgi:hypothetical protein
MRAAMQTLEEVGRGAARDSTEPVARGSGWHRASARDRSGGPAGQLLSAGLAGPSIALLDDEAGIVEAKERRSRDRLDGSVLRCDRCPPIHGRSFSRHHRLAKTAFRCGLVGERPPHVLRRTLPLPEGMGVEDRRRPVQRRDRIDVRGWPRPRPDRDPPPRRSLGVYLATSIARDSRITMTFTWPGYSS